MTGVQTCALPIFSPTGSLEGYLEVTEALAISDDPTQAYQSLVVSRQTTRSTFQVKTTLALSREQPVIRPSRRTVKLSAQPVLHPQQLQAPVLKDNFARLTSTSASRSDALPNNYYMVITTHDEQTTSSSSRIVAAQTVTSYNSATTLTIHQVPLRALNSPAFSQVMRCPAPDGLDSLELSMAEPNGGQDTKIRNDPVLPNDSAQLP